MYIILALNIRRFVLYADDWERMRWLANGRSWNSWGGKPSRCNIPGDHCKDYYHVTLLVQRKLLISDSLVPQPCISETGEQSFWDVRVVTMNEMSGYREQFFFRAYARTHFIQMSMVTQLLEISRCYKSRKNTKSRTWRFSSLSCETVGHLDVTLRPPLIR